MYDKHPDSQDVVLRLWVLVLRLLNDKRSGLGLGLCLGMLSIGVGCDEKVLVMVLVLIKSLRHFQDLDE